MIKAAKLIDKSTDCYKFRLFFHWLFFYVGFSIITDEFIAFHEEQKSYKTIGFACAVPFFKMILEIDHSFAPYDPATWEAKTLEVERRRGIVQ